MKHNRPQNDNKQQQATVDKLADLAAAAREEGLEVELPDALKRVERVGQFQQLVELTEASQELKHKVRHLLKLSPEKWDEVAAHAAAAVVPDFRPRVWWCPSVRGGLLFACRNGAVAMDQPLAFVGRGSAEADDAVVPLHQLDAATFNLLPKLKQQALQEWFAPGHSGWAVYWRDPDDPLAQQMAPPAAGAAPPALPLAALGTPPADAAGRAAAAAAGGVVAPSAAAQQQHQQQQHQQQQQYAAAAVSGGGGGMSSGGGGMYAGMGMGAAATPAAAGLSGAALAMHQQHAAMAAAGMSPTALLAAQQGGGMLSPAAAAAAGAKGPSPFASQGTQSSVPTDAFPAWAGSGQPPTRGPSTNGGAPPSSAGGVAGAAPPSRGVSAGGGVLPPRAPHGPSAGGASAAAGASAPPSAGGALPPAPQQPPQGPGPESKLNAMLPSLEMINTDDLPPIGANPSLFSLDSLQQMQMLGDLPSVGVGQLMGGGGAGGAGGKGAAAAGAAGAAAAGAGGGGGGAAGELGGAPSGVDRALSLRFSMSLDLAEVAAGAGSGGSGSASGGRGAAA